MASRTATVSTTIHEVRQIFQGFNENARFQTVLENEEFFTRICDAVLRPIYRCATQAKCPQHNKSPPRTRIIHDIAVQEGISHELPSNLEYTATAEIRPSSEQRVTQECAETPEHNQTLETSPSSERGAIQEPPSTSKHLSISDICLLSERSATQELLSTPEYVTPFDHNQTLETSPSERSGVQEPPLTPEQVSIPNIVLSSGRSATQERIETPGTTSVTESNSISDDASFLGDASTLTAFIPNSKRKLYIDSASDSAIELPDTFLPPNSLRAESPITIEDPDSGTEPSDNTADEDLALSKSSRAKSPATIEESDSGIELSDSTADEDLAPSSSQQAESPAAIEEPDSDVEPSDNVAAEDLTPLISAQVEISASTEQDQTISGDQATPKDQTESLYANRLSTNKISLKFDSWIQKPEEFWEHAENTIRLKKEGDAGTRLKVFVQDAVTKKADAEIQKLRYRFTSILVYQSFQKTMETNVISPRLAQHFFQRMNIPLESEHDCLLLLHGGKNRIHFNQQISPERDEIDHGPQCLPDLNDNM